MVGKAVIISAPSGAGKTTVVRHLLSKKELKLSFSVSACTRNKREGETEGKDYYFLTIDQFKTMIDNKEFIEWEEVYKNNYYGTLKSEIDRIWKMNRHVLYDVDVMGGINLKNIFKENALAIFILPPSVEVLQQRLEARGSETNDKIQKRLNKARHELKYANKFDAIIVNDDLNTALKECEKLVVDFLNKPVIQ